VFVIFVDCAMSIVAFYDFSFRPNPVCDSGHAGI
jgi:hypothetical protein